MCTLVSCSSNTDDLIEKYEELEVKYNECFTNYKELYEKYKSEIEEDLVIPIVIQSIANLIDEKAVVSIFDEKVVNIIVSYSKDITERVGEYAGMIPSALKTSGYDSCVISVIDASGKCVCGWTIYKTAEIDTFVSASFISK
jgi:hypothetical protein